jgi:hypothetical protein
MSLIDLDGILPSPPQSTDAQHAALMLAVKHQHIKIEEDDHQAQVALQPKKKRGRKPKVKEEVTVLACGTIAPNDTEMLLPYTDEELAAAVKMVTEDESATTTTEETDNKKKKKRVAVKGKRKRVAEFDPNSGEWTNVRRFDRMPITVEEAEDSEKTNKVPHGSYFVSLAHKRITGIIQLHERWLAKTKNQCSDYAEVQRNLMEFFSDVLDQFKRRYAIHTTHPQFESIGKTRKRHQRSPEIKIEKI